jgi:hypothetical protein
MTGIRSVRIVGDFPVLRMQGRECRLSTEVYCYYERRHFGMEEFKEIDNRLVHAVRPYHLTSGSLINIHMAEPDRVAAAPALEELRVRTLAPRWRDKL